MGCPTQVVLSNNLTFSVSTHNPATAALTDADALPSYRLYQDLVSTPILTGTMPKLDDPNTVGFYAQTVACTSANGFEAGKNYNIYIEATVGGVTGGITYAFNINAFPKAGATEYTYTVLNSATLAPIEGVAVWVTTDLAGANIVWSGTTDAFGVARDTVNNEKPWLDTGVWFFWRQLAGYSFANPDTENVP